MRGLAYRKYLLVVLLVILSFNSVDRLALGLVLQNIKADLHLSDTDLGLLSGIAFALFYSVMGIPIARWADQGNRVTIIAVTTAIWSAAVVLCGAAGSFMQLLLIRVGVAVGEAGCIPPAHSLIADYFTRAERPKAVATYMLGPYLSVVLGYFLAGWLNQFYGWRSTFMVLGAPGLVLAAIAWLTLREPRREKSNTKPSVTSVTSPAAQQPSLWTVCITLWSNRTFRHLLFCFSVVSFFGSGISQWQPAFLIRSYGFSTGELGTWYTVALGFGGFFGTYLGGALASRYASGNERLQLAAMAIVCASMAIISALTYVSPNRYMAFAFLSLAAIGASVNSGPLLATIQTLVPERMRAMSFAIVYLYANLIGMGLGPLAAGVLSDSLRPMFREESLRYALLALCPGYFWAAWHLWQARRTVSRDIVTAQVKARPATQSEDCQLLTSV